MATSGSGRILRRTILRQLKIQDCRYRKAVKSVLDLIYIATIYYIYYTYFL